MKPLKNKSNLVAEAILTSDSNFLEVTGLDIIKDGGVYDIIVAEFSTSTSYSGHVIRINGLGDNVYSFNHLVNGANNEVIHSVGKTSGIGYTNGWNEETHLFYTTATLIYFNSDWISLTAHNTSSPIDGSSILNITQTGALNSADINNINSLKIIPLDGDLIGHGSWIKVYKRR